MGVGSAVGILVGSGVPNGTQGCSVGAELGFSVLGGFVDCGVGDIVFLTTGCGEGFSVPVIEKNIGCGFGVSIQSGGVGFWFTGC